MFAWISHLSSCLFSGKTSWEEVEQLAGVDGVQGAMFLLPRIQLLLALLWQTQLVDLRNNIRASMKQSLPALKGEEEGLRGQCHRKSNKRPSVLQRGRNMPGGEPQVPVLRTDQPPSMRMHVNDRGPSSLQGSVSLATQESWYFLNDKLRSNLLVTV